MDEPSVTLPTITSLIRSVPNYPDTHKNWIQIACSECPQLLRTGYDSIQLYQFHRSIIRHEHSNLCDRLGFLVDEHLPDADLIGELQTMSCIKYTVLKEN